MRRVVLRIWRQQSPSVRGGFVRYEVPDAAPELSLLELLDILNERLVERGEDPVAFESDCREGICGTCGFMINGLPHGPLRGTATCQLHLRHLPEGEELVLEPFRAAAFPLIKDLVVDRGALDRIIAAGGFISTNTGAPQDANDLPVSKDAAERAMDAAACIGCGACVAACPNASASLFTGAKVTHLGLLPQGQPERGRRGLAMSTQSEAEGFGHCTWHGECHAACPKEISLDVITRLNHDVLGALLRKAHDEL